MTMQIDRKRRGLFILSVLLILTGIILNIFYYLNTSNEINFVSYQGWSPNSEQIIFSVVDGNYFDGHIEKYYIFKMADQSHWELEASSHLGPQWSPDGNLLLLLSNDQQSRNVYLYNAAGVQLQKIYSCEDICEDIFWDLSGKGIWVRECIYYLCPSPVYNFISINETNSVTHNQPAPEDYQKSITMWAYLGFTSNWLTDTEPADYCPNHTISKLPNGEGFNLSPNNEYFAYNSPDGTSSIVNIETCKTVFKLNKGTYYRDNIWTNPNITILRIGVLILGLVLFFFKIRDSFLTHDTDLQE